VQLRWALTSQMAAISDGHTQDSPDVEGGEEVGGGDGHEDLGQHGQAQESPAMV